MFLFWLSMVEVGWGGGSLDLLYCERDRRAGEVDGGRRISWLGRTDDFRPLTAAKLARR